MAQQKRLGLPIKPFFYTIDQVAYLLNLDEAYVRTSLLHYSGKTVGVCPRDKIEAVDVAPADKTPEWRVDERRLIRWMRFKGYKYSERGYV